jgi:hypothetical protein
MEQVEEHGAGRLKPEGGDAEPAGDRTTASRGHHRKRRVIASIASSRRRALLNQLVPDEARDVLLEPRACPVILVCSDPWLRRELLAAIMEESKSAR